MTPANLSRDEQRFVAVPGGRIAYDVVGDGPLVVLVPGMGDLRSTYRFLAPLLCAAGYRVASVDLRGHGGSDAGFSAYGDGETSRDVGAVVDELGGPAVVVGNSMGAGAAALLAAERPELVRALVLVGPFVRNGASAFQRLFLRLAVARPWAAVAWASYLPKLYSGRRPADFEEYRALVKASLQRPGYASAFSRTTRTDHRVVERRLPDVSAPALVVMGERDPDFRSPRDEADWVAARLDAEVVMVPDAGHYPQSQQPEAVAGAVITFLSRVGADA